MEVSGAIGSIIENGYRNMVHRDNDYIGEDGLLHCGECGCKKEHIVRFFGGRETKVPCMCLCDKRREFEAEQARLEEERRNRINRLWDSSMMDVKYRDARFETFKQTSENGTVYRLCERYVNMFDKFYSENQGLLFWGKVGTGKSYAAACISNELIEKGTSVLMTSFARILSLIRQGSEEEREILSQINSCKLVVFDDFGAERNTDYAMEKIFDVLDTRYRSKKPMIITTNVTFGEMKREEDIRYKRLYDRIFEVCFPVEFSTRISWRKEQANERHENTKRLLMDES